LDTIIACTTPFGRSGVAMLRISGQHATDIAAKLSNHSSLFVDRKAILLSIVQQDGQLLDSAIFIYMKGPRSFTGEDVIEISCHGNPLIVDKIIELAIEYGARPARKGEFTRRAVENNKLSMLQAEALGELIHSASIEGVQLAHAGLNGQIDNNEKEIREELLNICAEIEAKMDYPQEDLSYINDEEIAKFLRVIAAKSRKASDSWKGDKIRLQGAKVVILGPVNAGKSSLFNHLVDSKRAIVNSRPGTTRDIIERKVLLDGLEVCFFDTAGIRFETNDPIESEGIQMGLELAAEADLCLLVLPVDQDIGIMETIIQRIDGIPTLMIASHSDKDLKPSFPCDYLISNITKDGLQMLRNGIRDKLGLTTTNENRWIALSQRQYELFLSIADHLEMAASSLMGMLGPAVAAEEITQALERLAKLRGENAREKVLDRLFSKFCIGK
jgi:tRNA modification GTPase